MASTTSTRAATQGPRVRESAGGRRSERGADQQYDLLTAALIGALVGAGTTFLLRPRRRRVVVPSVDAARLAMKTAGAAGRRGAKWARRRGAHIDDSLRDYLGAAKSQIDDVVSSELRDLRKALRRQRRRLGI